MAENTPRALKFLKSTNDMVSWAFIINKTVEIFREFLHMI